MHHFANRNGVMHREDVSLEAVARELGTPAYVYSDAVWHSGGRSILERCS